MINNKKILAIIPARSGSKGLLGKNTKILFGKPLIAWSIDVALKSSYIDEVVVSTDSEEIADVAKKNGGFVPFLRPKELAQDNSATSSVLVHAINYMKQHYLRSYKYVVLLEPTSPIRDVKDIDLAIEILEKNTSAESIVSVSKTESQNPAFLVKLKDGFIKGYQKKNIKVLRRQEIEDVFFFDGSFYISDIQSYLTRKTFYHEKTLAHVVEKWKSFEIDDQYDFIMVEALMRYTNGLQTTLK